MSVPHDSLLTIIGVCGFLWCTIWYASRQEPKWRNALIGAAIGLPTLAVLLTGCLTYAIQVQAERICTQYQADCDRGRLADWGSWLPLALSFVVVACAAIAANTSTARAWTAATLASGPQATSIAYCAALVLRIQPAVFGFVGLVVLFSVGGRDSGASLLATSLMCLLIASLFTVPVVWIVVSIHQLGKVQQAGCGAYVVAPFVFIIAMLSNHRVDPLMGIFRFGDSRYVALVVVFGSLSAYAAGGQLLADKLHANLESLQYLTASWGWGSRFDPAPTLKLLRRVRRTAHAVAVITAGIAIGFVPSALHLGEALGMIVGVGFVALVSYLDAELAIRHMQ